MRWTAVRHAPIVALLALAALPAAAGQTERADHWWNAAWACRKRVRVKLPATKPLIVPYHTPGSDGDDVIAARARIVCESPPKTSAQREIRVVDAGGNVLPCVAAGPDARGIIQVIFPARRTIAGRLAGPIQEGTKEVVLSVGRNKAVTPGMRFHVPSGTERVATLEVKQVAATTSTARVIEKRLPGIAKGSAVRSQDLTGAEYHIYYGNPSAKEDSPSWSPKSAAVTQVTWRVGSVPTSLNGLDELLRGNPERLGTTRRTQINSRSNPLGSPGEGHLLSAYETYIHCPIPGLYRFSIDTDGPSFLFVNGAVVAIRPGFFIRSRQWEHRGKVKLGVGYHRLLLFAIESGRGVVTRLGWQPITAKVYSLMPTSVYAPYVEAEVVGYEGREERARTFFTYTAAPRTLLVAKKRRYQFVQFHNFTTIEARGKYDTVTYLWQFGDEERSRKASPGHLFALAGGTPTESFDVTLRAFVGGKLAGEYRRRVHLETRPDEKLRVAADIVSFANIVYEDERTSIAVRLRNASFTPIILRAVGRMQTAAGKDIILNRPMVIQAMDEGFCILPLDMKELSEKRAIIELELLLGSQRVASTSARIIPSPEELHTLRRGLGALYDPDGRRVMICAEIEEADRHLRWVFFRYLRDEVYARASDTRQRVLLFGDRMDNPVTPEKSFTDYVAILESRFKKHNRPFQFVPRSTGLVPTLADLVRLAKTLRTTKPLPDIIIISPGPSDVAQAAGARDFTRSIDVMVDLVRATSRRTKIIIVSPPPYPANPRLSTHYTEQLNRVAKRHHVPFVDLDKLLTRGEADWPKTYYAPPDAEGILWQNPNEAAHRLIADEIFKQLY